MLLLDEPAAGVPQDESAELFAVIANLSKDITVLFIEHDMNVVFRFASRIIVMVGGRILVEGTPEEIAADPRVREVYLGKAGHGARAGRIMAEPLLALDDVRAGYGDAVVLDGISLEVPEHGSLAVLGRNGVGKSTLLLTIMGYTNVSRGTITLARRRTSRSLPPHRRARDGLGWVAQEREIFPSLSVEENLTVASRPGRWDLKAVYELFPRLDERRASMGNQLSGGEQQMLAIARALMTNPALLLLDEPLEGLAPIIVEELTAAIRRMTADAGHRLHPGRAARRGRAVAHAGCDRDRARRDRASRALARAAAGSGHARPAGRPAGERVATPRTCTRGVVLYRAI